jgi:hypothetical protein
MLFDLRGRGRRRTIQMIYLGLAVLMGGGLIFFGVGGSGVGLFNNDNGATGGTGSNTASVTAARKATEKRPQDPAAWLNLARRAAANAEVDQSTGTYTAKGKTQLPEAARAWARYLALKPNSVDPNAAQLLANVFATDGLNRPKDQAAALQVVAQARPSLGTYRNLALAAYAGKLTRLGDLAAAEALKRTTKQNRATVKQQFAAAKAVGAKGAAGASGTAGTTTVSP